MTTELKGKTQKQNTLLKPMDGASDQPWVQALRETGAEVFNETGLPTPAWEDWKYTSLRAFADQGFRHLSSASSIVDVADLPQKFVSKSLRIVFVNGRFQQALSDDIDGIEFYSLAKDQADWMRDYLVNIGDLALKPFKALNTAGFEDGAVIRVSKEVKIDLPVEILFYNQGCEDCAPAFYPRNLFMVEDGAELSLIEHHTGKGIYFANHMTEIVVKADAKLNHYRLQNESLEATHISTVSLTQFKKSVFESVALTLGAKLSVIDVNSKLIEESSSCTLKTSYAMLGGQHCNHTIKIDHFEPDCKSDQMFRGIIDGQACAVFQGKIHVCRNAQGTDGRQSHHALLLSETAEVFAKPELEIYADDVKCTHGATAGQLDEDALFYLRTRGIPEAEARSLLIQSFLNDVIQDIMDDDIRDAYVQRMDQVLGENR